MQYYIGLMSGTSLDGIDCAIVRLGDRHLELIDTHLEPLSAALKTEALASTTTGIMSLDRLGALDLAFGRAFTDATLNLLQKTKIPKHQIAAIGCSGQTIRHQPNGIAPFTIQIGDPNFIAKQTGITVISDFRRADMVYGGQGAPLVPRFHTWITPHDPRYGQVVLNIGGIANITVIPKNHIGPILGYDTGPGNALLDAWCEQQWQEPFDQDGKHGLQGKVNTALLSMLLNDPYFSRKPPKSTGKEKFNLDWLSSCISAISHAIKPEDVQATLVELTAQTIAAAIMSHTEIGQIWICGGGAHNLMLIERLRAQLPKEINLAKTDDFGLPVDWVEAICFAWLAKARLENQPGNLPSVTGASQETTLGAIYAPI